MRTVNQLRKVRTNTVGRLADILEHWNDHTLDYDEQLARAEADIKQLIIELVGENDKNLGDNLGYNRTQRENRNKLRRQLRNKLERL